MSNRTLEWAMQVVNTCEEDGIALSQGLIDLCPMVAVVLWARNQKRHITHTAVQAAFGVSRATAFRWLDGLHDLQSPLVVREAPARKAAPSFIGGPRL